MKDVKYPFCSVFIEPPTELSQSLINWTRENVDDSEIYVKSGSAAYGREDEMHITLLYGLVDVTLDDVKPLFEDTDRFNIHLGKIRVFERKNFDVIYLDVLSSLTEFNTRLKVLPHIEKHGIYIPHLTLAYVKKGKSGRFRYMKAWQGTRFQTNHIVFSSKDGLKEYFRLGNP